MALLPNRNILDGTKVPATTTGDMKTALGSIYDFLSGLLGTDSTDKVAARAALAAAPLTSSYLSKSMSGGVDVTLTTLEATNNIIVLTGTLTVNINLIVPTTTNEWVIRNNTTGAFSITVKTAAGTGIVVAQTKQRQLFCDGTNVLSVMTDFTDNPQPAIPTSPTVRQVVMGGVTNSSGYANMLSAGTGLNINLAATATPMRTAFAAAASDYVATLSTDTTNVTAIPASNLSYISQDYVTATSVTWTNTLAPPQYGYSYNQAAQGVLQFGGAAGSTTFLDDFGNTWTAQGGAKVQTNLFKFGTGALGGGGASNVLNGSTDYIKSTSFTSLGAGSWSIRGWFYFTSLAAGNSGFIGANNASGYGVWLAISGGKTVLNSSSTGSTFDIASGTAGTATLVINTWYFIEITYDAVAGKYFIYVNGILDQTITTTLKVCGITNVTLGFANTAGTLTYMTGYLDKPEILPYCNHPNGTTYTVPAAAPNITTQGYASDFFSIPNMTMYQVSAASVSAGANPAFTAKNRVYVAEAQAGASTVSSVTNYALNGRYVSAETGPLPGATVSVTFNTNLGVASTLLPALELVCYTAEDMYVVGEIVPAPFGSGNGSYTSPYVIRKTNRNTAKFLTYANIPWYLPSGAGNIFTATAANWKYRVSVQRGW